MKNSLEHSSTNTSSQFTPLSNDFLKKRAVPNTEIFRHTQNNPWNYTLLNSYQKKLGQKILHNHSPGTLLLSELSPIITLGKRANSQELTLPESVLQAHGIEILQTDRGGLGTYHGPGQWVLFLIDSLERLVGDPRGVKKAVEGLLEIGLKFCKKYHPSTHIRTQKETGVWTEKGKIASVGVQVENGILYHGMAINIYKTPSSFLGLRPCGLDLPVDYLVKNNFSSPFTPLSTEEFLKYGSELIQITLQQFYEQK